MATPREVRELAFRVLYELDAGNEPADPVELAEQPDRFSKPELDRVRSLAEEAYRGRFEADTRLEVLAPTWPATRQPAVDRAIIRLAFAELRRGNADARVIINEAVELAKRYSTEKSPGFVNAILDKMSKKVEPTSDAGSTGWPS